MSEEMKSGGIIELRGVKEKVSTIEAELARKGIDSPGFSVLKGYIEDRIGELRKEVE